MNKSVIGCASYPFHFIQIFMFFKARSTHRQPLTATWLVNAGGVGSELDVMAESYVGSICFLYLLIAPAGFG